MPYALCTQVFPIYCGREARHLRPADAGPGPKELLLSRHNPFVPSLSEWLPPPPPLPRFSACSFLSPSLCHRPYPSPPPRAGPVSLLPLPPLSLHLSPSVSLSPSLALQPLLVFWFLAPLLPLSIRLQCPFADLEVQELGVGGEGALSHPVSLTQLEPWVCGRQAKEEKRPPKEGFFGCLFSRGGYPRNVACLIF